VSRPAPAADRGRLPNFFVIGAQKAGTSTLHRLLQQHPQAFMCDPKEPQFFSAGPPGGGGLREGSGPDPDWYRSLFAGAGEASAVGEASTTYAMYPHYSGVPARLTALVAEPKLVYIVREPLARMRSAYLHGVAGGTETRPIARALTADPRYLLTSCYALQLRQWLAYVPRERILLLSLEQLRDAPEAVLPRLFGFLGVDPAWRPARLPSANVSEGKLAPRRWWRALGAATLRYDKTHWVPDWMGRLNDSASPLVRREVPADELAIGDPVASQLHRALAADRVALRRLWADATPPQWLQSDAAAR
jgi:hypothetical protein